MKRNPKYTPPQPGKVLSFGNGLIIKVPANETYKTERNGYYDMKFAFVGGVDNDGHPLPFESYYPKQEKFNKIFDVQDAAVETSDTVYIGCDFANGEDITAYTLFYDCKYCHGSGCDICGSSGKSMNPVSKEDSERYIKKYNPESGYMFPEYRTKKQ